MDLLPVPKANVVQMKQQDKEYSHYDDSSSNNNVIDDFNSYYDGLSEIPISQYQSDGARSGMSRFSKRSKMSRMTKKSGLSGGSIKGVKVYRMKQNLVDEQIEEEHSDDSNENRNGLKKRLSIQDNGDIYSQLMKIKISDEKRNQIMALIAEENDDEGH